MSGSGAVDIVWADGEHRFRLPIGLLRELQDKTDAGPAQVFERLRLGTWRVDEIRETIRLGLIGGGMAPLDALTLVVRYVDARPLLESVNVAFAILAAALIGVPDDQPGKRNPEREQQAKDGSPSPESSRPGPSSDSQQGRSMN